MNWSKLIPAASRTFVPLDAFLTDKDTVTGLYRQLVDRSIETPRQFERWILDRSELEAALSQAGSILYIDMTCATDDPKRASAYQAFVEQVEPAVKPLGHQLNKKFLEFWKKYPLNARRYEVHGREIRAEVDLFADANVPLQTEVAMLSQEYQSVCGAMTVDFDGKARTLPEMGKFLLEPDRELRERAWRATAARRLKDKERLETLFDTMRGLRARMAVNAGCPNFRDYMFKAYHRFDYTPEDCKAYHRSVREIVLPLRREIDSKRRKDMGLSVLRPWDTAVDPFSRPRLRPFDSAAHLVSGVSRMAHRLDPQLGNFFDDMNSSELLDLESRKGKAPGGYQNTLNEARKPFIFMNAVGVDDDVRTLLHESGHAFHAYLCADDVMVDYRHAPMEFCEVASMSMELMADGLMGEFYDEPSARRSSIEHLEGVISILPWVATVDSFQHWIYENPAHSPEERRKVWQQILVDFGGGVVDWSGLEEERAYLWHRQLHLFEVPFYYIEYGIAQLGALQIWQHFRKDPVKAVADYKKGLALGGSRPLPELFAAAGIRFDFSRDIIGPLMDDVHAEWKRLSA